LEPLILPSDDAEYVRVGWAGLLHILDTVYPADVFDGSSGDVGPQIIVHLREIDRLRHVPDRRRRA
jgi:hypothetical protein